MIRSAEQPTQPDHESPHDPAELRYNAHRSWGLSDEEARNLSGFTPPAPEPEPTSDFKPTELTTPASLFEFVDELSGEIVHEPYYDQNQAIREAWANKPGVVQHLDQRRAAFTQLFATMSEYNQASGRLKQPDKALRNSETAALKRNATTSEARSRADGIMQSTVGQVERLPERIRDQYGSATGKFLLEQAGMPIDPEMDTEDFEIFNEKFKTAASRDAFLKKIGAHKETKQKRS